MKYYKIAFIVTVSNQSPVLMLSNLQHPTVSPLLMLSILYLSTCGKKSMHDSIDKYTSHFERASFELKFHFHQLSTLTHYTVNGTLLCLIEQLYQEAPQHHHQLFLPVQDLAHSFPNLNMKIF
ncbi:conserved hypothetical protein [Trichinella spiralis]|uniref:hypothetical protein n=1 Tax=Trichinella spiralis TaxID=6334 RepID=UPI0001EFE9A4|nr:conserved hypothetical protein [Trichinella spiralis]